MSPYYVTLIPGKGEGLVATRDLSPGTLLLDEAPLVKLDPPCKRNELLKLLGCRAFSTIDMRTTPDKIRAQIHKMILEKTVDQMSETDRAKLFSLSDKNAALTNGNKSLWGIWQTNSIPLGSYRVSGIFPTVVKLNHSCRPNAHHFWNQELQREQVFIVEPVRCGEEITISYIRTFCSRKFRQSLLFDRFGFLCTCLACGLTADLADRDDRNRLEIDKLSQKFAQCRQASDFQTAASIGEEILLLMQEVGFNPSVQWPGFFNCFELYLQLGDIDRARFYVHRAYDLVCIAQGETSSEARTMLKYKNSPELYLKDYKVSDQHFITTMTHC